MLWGEARGANTPTSVLWGDATRAAYTPASALWGGACGAMLHATRALDADVRAPTSVLWGKACGTNTPASALWGNATRAAHAPASVLWGGACGAEDPRLGALGHCAAQLGADANTCTRDTLWARDSHPHASLRALGYTRCPRGSGRATLTPTRIVCALGCMRRPRHFVRLLLSHRCVCLLLSRPAVLALGCGALERGRRADGLRLAARRIACVATCRGFGRLMGCGWLRDTSHVSRRAAAMGGQHRHAAHGIGRTRLLSVQQCHAHARRLCCALRPARRFTRTSDQRRPPHQRWLGVASPARPSCRVANMHEPSWIPEAC